MNIFEGKVVETGAETVVELPGGGRATVAVASEAGDRSATVRLGVRPEDLGPVEGNALFAGDISIVEALGETTLLHFAPQHEDLPVIAKLPGIHGFKRGETVHLGADPAKLHLFGADGLSYYHR